jgi:hypothetical protein
MSLFKILLCFCLVTINARILPYYLKPIYDSQPINKKEPKPLSVNISLVNTLFNNYIYFIDTEIEEQNHIVLIALLLYN